MGLFGDGAFLPDGDNSITGPIFAPPTWSNTDLNAGEDPNDFWVDVWPEVGSGPCSG
jgi:hypothetical protein